MNRREALCKFAKEKRKSTLFKDVSSLKKELVDCDLDDDEIRFVTDFITCYGSIVYNALHDGSQTSFQNVSNRLKTESYYQEEAVDLLLRDLYYACYDKEPN